MADRLRLTFGAMAPPLAEQLAGLPYGPSPPLPPSPRHRTAKEARMSESCPRCDFYGRSGELRRSEGPNEDELWCSTCEARYRVFVERRTAEIPFAEPAPPEAGGETNEEGRDD